MNFPESTLNTRNFLNKKLLFKLIKMKNITFIFLVIIFLNLNKIKNSEQCFTIILNTNNQIGDTTHAPHKSSFYSNLTHVITRTSIIATSISNNKTTSKTFETVVSSSKVTTTGRFSSLSTKMVTSTIQSHSSKTNSILLTEILVQNSTFGKEFFGYNRGFDSIDVDAFRNFSYLTSVELSFNNLSYIINGTFDHLINLEFLFLTGNMFITIKDMNLNNLHMLKLLNIAKNELQSFDFDDISTLPNLVELYLDSNKITKMSLKNKNGNESILFLFTESNPIANYSWILDLPQLELLSIHANSSVLLPPKYFSQSKSLIHLILYNISVNILQNLCLYLNNLPKLKYLQFDIGYDYVNISSFNCEA